jgi:hypothetical protein
MSNYTLLGRMIYGVIYAALQAFIAACAAYLTAKLLGSSLMYAARRAAVRSWRLLGWLAAGFFTALGRMTVEPVRDAWRGLSNIAADARDAAIRSRLATIDGDW